MRVGGVECLGVFIEQFVQVQSSSGIERYLHRGIRRRRIVRTRGTPFFKGDNNTVEYADALHPAGCTWARVSSSKIYPLHVALIHDTCSIATKQTSIHCNTAQTRLDAYQTPDHG